MLTGAAGPRDTSEPRKNRGILRAGKTPALRMTEKMAGTEPAATGKEVNDGAEGAMRSDPGEL